MKTKKIIKKYYKYLLLFVLLSIFLVIAKDVFKKEIFQVDHTLYDFLVKHRNIVFNIFFMTITELGSAEILIIITIACIIFMKNKYYRFLIPINLAFIGLFNQILKLIFERPRPNQLRLIEENGYSFPSGHAMASTAFYGLLIIYVYNHIENAKLRNSLCIGLSLLIILIDLSRIYVGVHYASDVIAGSCLSISYLIILLLSIGEKMKISIAKEENTEATKDIEECEKL